MVNILKYKGKTPEIHESCFIANSADIIGMVDLGENVNVWFGSVLRGDTNRITIGENTNVQDLSMLHVDSSYPLTIGRNVTIGHSVNLHGCIIEDSCLIGIGSTVLDGAVIGKNSLVAAGTLVPPGKVYPAGSFIIGSPAQLKRGLTVEEIEQYSNHYKTYLRLSSEYKN